MSQSFGKNPKQGGNAGKWLPFTLFYTYLKEGDMMAPGPSNLFVFLDEHPNSIKRFWVCSRMLLRCKS